ncbi:hypothetical protein P4S63_02125 [Pseudoalteromonas sp. B193]
MPLFPHLDVADILAFTQKAAARNDSLAGVVSFRVTRLAKS